MKLFTHQFQFWQNHLLPLLTKQSTKTVTVLWQRLSQLLYSPLGQELAAKHYFRPRNPQVAAKYAAQFPKIKLFTINDVFGGWAKAQKTHFANGAIFDQIYDGKQ